MTAGPAVPSRHPIAVFGVPRSGTSWLAQIMNSHPDVLMRYQPLFSWGHKGRLTTGSSGADILAFFDEIAASTDPFATMSSDFHRNHPRFAKSPSCTHIVFKEVRYLQLVGTILSRCGAVRVIGIVRGPLGTLASWISAPKEFDPSWNILDEWRNAPRKNQARPEEYFGFGRWCEVARDFLAFEKAFPGQFLLVRYASLAANPADETKRIFAFCGLEMAAQTLDFLSESTSRHDEDPYSVYRARVDQDRWRRQLPHSIVEEVRSTLHGTDLETFLDPGAGG